MKKNLLFGYPKTYQLNWKDWLCLLAGAELAFCAGLSKKLEVAY